MRLYNSKPVIKPLLKTAMRAIRNFDARLFIGNSSIILLAIIYSFFIGGSILILPPGIVAIEALIPALLLLWSMPDLRIDFSRLLLVLIHAFIFSQISVPNFYAIPVAGLGWVNLRKVEIISLLAVTALAYASSQEVRNRALSTIKASKLFNYCVIGFVICLIASVPLSRTPQISLSLLAQPLTTWYPVYFAILAVEDIHLKIGGLAKSLIINVVIIAVICVIERRLQRRIMFDIMPASLIESLLQNPSFSMLYLYSGLRAGAFRAAASFTTALSTGECAAMVLPLAFYLAFHKAGIANKLFGCIGIVAVGAVLLTTSARGAMLASIATSSVYLCLAILLLGKRNRTSLLPWVMSFSALSLLPAVTLTDKFRYTVFGGGATAGSNAGRTEQLRLAIPKFFESPIWGHGIGTGAETVGFNPGNYFTLDSYAIAISIEAGLPGLVCLLVILFYPALDASRLLISSNGSQTALEGVMLALPVFAFGINMLVLAQIENHGLLFLFFGLFAVWRKHARSLREDLGFNRLSLAMHHESWQT